MNCEKKWFEMMMFQKAEASEDRLSEEVEKNEKLRLEFQKTVREKESAHKAYELEHIQEVERNEALAKEIEEIRYKYQIMQKQRSNTVYLSGAEEGGPAAAALRDLETEIRQLRSENSQLGNQLEEMKAHAIKNDLDSGRMLLHLAASNSPSLAAEMDIMSKDEVSSVLLILNDF